MVKKISLAVMLLTFIGSISLAQNSSETRKVDKFDRISASSGIEVCINEGTSSEITIEASNKDVLDRVRVEVKKGELRIGMDNKGWKRPRNLKVKVTLSANSLKGVSASSGASVHNAHVLAGDAFTTSASSGAILNLNIKAQNMSCDASSGAVIKIKGSTQSLKTEASSGAVIDMKKLTAENATASASSGANVSLHVDKNLTASASSGGNITYSGKATVSAKKSSGGNVSKR